MPSTVVHVSLALLIAAGILGSAFDRRALVVVGAVAVVPDLDVFASLVVESTHRAMLHTLFVPGALSVLLYYDTRIRQNSWVRARYGAWGIQVGWAAICGYVFAGIGLDLFTPLGVNVLYPVYDQFISLNGALGYSTDTGFVQTFVEFASNPPGRAGPEGGAPSVHVGQRGSTEEVHVSSGVDPSKGSEPDGVKRVFPVAYRGWHLTLILTTLAVLWGRFRLDRTLEADRERDLEADRERDLEADRERDLVADGKDTEEA